MFPHLLGNHGPVTNRPIKVTSANRRSVSGLATCTWHSSLAGNGHCSTKLEVSPGGHALQRFYVLNRL